MRTRNTEQEDHLLRLIKQAAEALRRLREQLAGSAEAAPSVRDEVRQSVAQLLGDEGPLLGVIDAHTAVRLLGSARKLEVWTQLLELEADAAEQHNKTSEAQALRARVTSLRAAAAQLGE